MVELRTSDMASGNGRSTSEKLVADWWDGDRRRGGGTGSWPGPATSGSPLPVPHGGRCSATLLGWRALKTPTSENPDFGGHVTLLTLQYKSPQCGNFFILYIWASSVEIGNVVAKDMRNSNKKFLMLNLNVFCVIVPPSGENQCRITMPANPDEAHTLICHSVIWHFDLTI